MRKRLLTVASLLFVASLLAATLLFSTSPGGLSNVRSIEDLKTEEDREFARELIEITGDMDANDIFSPINLASLQLSVLDIGLSNHLDLGIKDVDSSEAVQDWNNKYSKVYTECNTAVTIDILGGAENVMELRKKNIDNSSIISLDLSTEEIQGFVGGVIECPGSEELVKILIDNTAESIGGLPGDCDYKGLLKVSFLISFAEGSDDPEKIISEKYFDNSIGKIYDCPDYESFVSRFMNSILSRLIEVFELLPEEDQSKIDMECLTNFVDANFLKEFRDLFIQSIKAETYPYKYDNFESDEQFAMAFEDKLVGCAPELEDSLRPLIG